MSASFVRRRIDVAIKLSIDTQTNQPRVFAENQKDTITLSRNRTSVRVQNSGAASGSVAQISVWGLGQSLMNQLSTLGMVLQLVPGNSVTVTAGDADGGMSTVFVGTVLEAYADYTGAPDVPMRFNCRAGADAQVRPYPASSYTGATDVAVILSAIAQTQQWGFENSGVNVQLSNPYYAGSAMEQVKRIEEDAGINAQLINNVLCVWPRYGHRQSQGGIPLISPETGMIGYPAFSQQPGIIVKTIFDPRITFGTQVKVQSSVFTADVLRRANNAESIWNVSKLDLWLDAEMPKGQWMSVFAGYNPGVPQPLPPRALR